MDPIATEITAALLAGLAGGAGIAGKNMLVDAYEALKVAIKQKLGVEKEGAKEGDRLEANANACGSKDIPQEEIEPAQAEKDTRLVRLTDEQLAQHKAQPSTIIEPAQADQNAQLQQLVSGLLTQLQDRPGTTSQKIRGKNNILADHSTVTVTYATPIKD